MSPRNLFIDPETDNLVLFDFGVSVKIGYKVPRYHRGEASAELKERNDVKGVVVTLHEILTRDPRYATTALHYLDETDLLTGPEKWVKRPDVELDEGLDAVDYYNELMRWVRARRERPITVYTDASEPIDWPTEIQDPPPPVRVSYERDVAEKLNLPYIEWARPRSAHLDRSRRLLATGKYADEPGSTVAAGNKTEPVPAPVESKPGGKTAGGQEHETQPGDNPDNITTTTTTPPSHPKPNTPTNAKDKTPDQEITRKPTDKDPATKPEPSHHTPKTKKRSASQSEAVSASASESASLAASARDGKRSRRGSESGGSPAAPEEERQRRRSRLRVRS